MGVFFLEHAMQAVHEMLSSPIVQHMSKSNTEDRSKGFHPYYSLTAAINFIIISMGLCAYNKLQRCETLWSKDAFEIMK